MLIFVVRVLYFFVCAGALYNFINQPTLDLPYSTAILLFVLLFVLLWLVFVLLSMLCLDLDHPWVTMHRQAVWLAIVDSQQAKGETLVEGTPSGTRRGMTHWTTKEHPHLREAIAREVVVVA